MRRLIFLLFLFHISGRGHAQKIDGIYVALEFNGLRIDSTGKVDFYMQETFPYEKWFHEVKVVIKGNRITIEKSPVSYDSAGNKSYSASDGGFLTYKGTISRSRDLYYAKTKLVAFDYIGFSAFEPPIIVNDLDSTVIDTVPKETKRPPLKELRRTHDVAKGVHGLEVFLPKGTLRQDYIIRQDKDGIWINNQFYYHRKE